MNLSALATDARAALEARHPEWTQWSLDSYLAFAARDYGDRPLVITDDKTLTYDEVIVDKARNAAALRSLGVRHGDRVGILMTNHADVVPLIFTIWSMGCIAVPFNTLYRRDELAYVLKQSGCAVVVAMAAIFGRDMLAEFDEIEPGWRRRDFSRLPEMKALLIFEGTDDPATSWPHLLAAQPAAAELPQGRAASPSDPAIIMYTSGTTGSPKGAVHTHDSLLRAGYCNAFHHGFEDGRRAVFSLPLYHTYGLVTGLLSGLLTGGSIIVLPRFDPARLLAAIGRHKATWILAVPTMTAALLEETAKNDYDLSSLRAIHSAAAPTPTWVWQKIQTTFGVEEVFTSYGQTETSMVTCTQSGDPLEVVSVTQGIIALAGVAGIPELGGQIAALRIMDPETGEVLPPGSTGELCAKGPTATIGYFRKPEETAALFTEDDWLKMGDLGRFRDDGNLLLVGRSKEVFKSRGELVAPKEIEEILTTHPGIAQAFVIAMPDDRSGECGCAWIVKADPALGEDDVRSFLETRVARYKMVRDVWFIADEDLPRTGTGKIQKMHLRARAEALLSG